MQNYPNPGTYLYLLYNLCYNSITHDTNREVIMGEKKSDIEDAYAAIGATVLSTSDTMKQPPGGSVSDLGDKVLAAIGAGSVAASAIKN